MLNKCLFIAFATATAVTTHAQNIGIGTTNPATTFHVSGGSVLFTSDTGSANISGPGKRLMWVPGKAAFRAGGIEKSELPNIYEAWDEHNIGRYSFAAGNSTKASGEGAVSLGGPNSSATGTNSFSMGTFTGASGNHAFNHNVYGGAYGDYSLAIGHTASANGFSSRAMGSVSDANGDHATAIGHFVTAQSYASVVLGQYNIVEGNPKQWVNTDPALVYGNGNHLQPSNAFTLFKNGSIIISGTLKTNSDQRLKKDVTQLSNSLNKVLALNGYNYHWQNQDIYENTLQTGLMAQEVRQQMPELVHEAEDKTLSVNYNGITPYLVESIKALKKEIDLLQQELKQLKERH